MHMLSRKRYQLLISAFLVAVFLLLVPTSYAQDEEPPADTAIFSRATQATVFLMQIYDQDGLQIISCMGSGTIISADGLILTNAHLGSPLGICRGDRVIVALPVRVEDPPVPTYIAEVVQENVDDGLAVLQIKGSLDGSLIDPDALNLPFVTIGDPSALIAGGQVQIVGYPDVGATPVQYESRLLTSPVSEKWRSRLSWFRLDSTVPGGMSGGGVYDIAGKLIGIASSAPATEGNNPAANCLSIQDSNRDGKIDPADICAPIGDPVQVIKPINFAQAMVEAARNNFQFKEAPGFLQLPSQDLPIISRVFFSSQITNEGLPVDVITQAPSGITGLYVFFDYHNMRPGSAYQLRVTRDGIEVPQMSLGPVPWGESQQGQWFIGTENVIWADGNYEFTILVDGSPEAAGRIPVGPAGYDAQRFKNLSFSSISAAGEVAASGTVLPALIQEIRAFYEFEGMIDQQDWTEVWYLDGTEISRVTRLWDNGSSGRLSVSAVNISGLPIGTYRVELFIGDRLALTGDVLLAGNPKPGVFDPYVFSNPLVFNEISREGVPTGYQGPVLPLGINSIYLFFDYDYMPNGQPWTYRFFLDGKLIGSGTQLWDAGGVGQDFWVSLNSSNPLPEGKYDIEVLAFGKPMISATASVGSGTQPTSGTEAEADEVFISGSVLDALTENGIPGTLVIVLDVRFESAQFTWDEAQIWTQGITDRDGKFSLQRGLPRGAYYTVYVFAEGYYTLLEDFFVITRAQPSPVETVILLNRP